MPNDIAERVVLIANPAAGRGRGARALPAARAALASSGTRVLVTAGAGDERRLARSALDAGATAIVALGGDGTWSNVAAAILEARSECVLAPLAAGTGSDWVKTLGLPAHDAAATAALIAAGRWGAVDAGAADDGGDAPTHFINVASFGFPPAATAVAARARWLRGEALYLYAALTQLFGFPGFSLGVETERGAERVEGPQLLAAAGVGRHFGGKFAIAPDADPRDGLLDLVRVGDAGPMRRAALFAAARRGLHVREPEVRSTRAARVTLAFAAPPAWEADGELRQARRRDVTLRCLPGALRVAGA